MKSLGTIPYKQQFIKHSPKFMTPYKYVQQFIKHSSKIKAPFMRKKQLIKNWSIIQIQKKLSNIHQKYRFHTNTYNYIKHSSKGKAASKHIRQRKHQFVSYLLKKKKTFEKIHPSNAIKIFETFIEAWSSSPTHRKTNDNLSTSSKG